ncbi:helix-turn-helix transcriptional regulator [Paenibacillus sp. OV219]|uniref:helix-turn-helix transcriptional regulator n=1 Tax=Paenibacillus sp. OV219 TaxID=1884377 RepID=UPI0008CFD3E2|nr:response regulator transcription factor [Paenibacillus sp. OV219]SEO31843.1 Helix-turn-helix domain-containing protein [Paenibacillus sp. OV219]
MTTNETLLTGLEQFIAMIDLEWPRMNLHSGGIWRNTGWDGVGYDFELSYYIQGTNTIRQDGTVVHVAQNDLLFLPDTIRNSSCEEGSFKVIFLAFQFKDEALKEQLRHIYKTINLQSKPLTLPGLEEDFLALITEMRSGKPSPHLTKHLFIHILVKIYRAVHLYHGKANSKTLKHEPMIQEIIKDLNENYGDPLSLAEIAERYELNERYLNQIFKSMTGIPLGRYLMKIRIEQAKRLLRTTHLQVTDIALDTGFFDAAHFCKSFKKYTDYTPAEYKARMENELHE